MAAGRHKLIKIRSPVDRGRPDSIKLRSQKFIFFRFKMQRLRRGKKNFKNTL